MGVGWARAGLVAAVCLALICTWAKGRGYWTRTVRLVWQQYRVPVHVPRPMVTASRPGNQDGNVLPDAFVACDVELPNSGRVVDGSTLRSSSVRLYRSVDRQPVPAIINTSGGGDDIVLRPTLPLDLNTQYTFEVTPDVKDTGGCSFRPYRATFTTAASTRFSDFPVAFERVSLSLTAGHQFTCVTIGPDHRLYASALTGEIIRYGIQADGTLASPQQINTVNERNGAMRLVTGITFDPSASAQHLLLWVSHGQLPAGGEKGQAAIRGADDWSGKISLLSGANLEMYRDVIVRLPRAAKDHLNNQIAFGPDGALYFCQASNTAMGAPDHKWGFRPERLLTSAILRLDTKAALALSQPLDVKTEEDGHYDPFAANAPLSIYATGVRNSFDLVWHSNGHLYAATNGSAAGGNAPGTPTMGADQRRRIDADELGPYAGPTVPSLRNVSQTEDDWLFAIKRGAYYGHPNPARAEFVLDGGHPSLSADTATISAYPLGTLPDRNYHPPIFSFGKNVSPCGGIEYQSDAFHGLLKHKLLYVRYSGGGDIAVVTLSKDGGVAECMTGIEGLNRLVNPVDIWEDTPSGRLYVAEFGAKRLTLLRPMIGMISRRVCRAGGKECSRRARTVISALPQ